MYVFETDCLRDLRATPRYYDRRCLRIHGGITGMDSVNHCCGRIVRCAPLAIPPFTMVSNSIFTIAIVKLIFGRLVSGLVATRVPPENATPVRYIGFDADMKYPVFAIVAP